MEQTPTAAEILYKHYPECTAQIEFKCMQAMKEFAKIHVEVALKAASEKATTVTKENNRLIFGNPQHFEWEEIDLESILMAYPKEFIQ